MTVFTSKCFFHLGDTLLKKSAQSGGLWEDFGSPGSSRQAEGAGLLLPAVDFNLNYAVAGVLFMMLLHCAVVALQCTS
jgi:hypothetical protein